MLTEELVAFFFDDDEAVFDSEELMLVLEEFTSWFLEDELLVTSSEEVRVSVFGAEELSSPQAANKIDAASTKSFFNVFSLFELFPVQI